jgi:teichuronic acid biosynthesis glycosyltransferase TuaC
MRVMFICSGNKADGINSIVHGQGRSLANSGIDLSYFLIKGKGFIGYVKSIFKLRRHLLENKYDILHAHYSLSGFATTFSGGRPIAVSLMGSDIFSSRLHRYMIKFFSKWYWAIVIVKSEGMKMKIGIESGQVIPNGVFIEEFKPLSKEEAKKRVDFNEKKHIIFVGDPGRPEKNIQLATKSVSLLKDENIEFHIISNQPHERLSDYMNAADVLLLTSTYEGSPNVIKEAMACNCPIVATDVGDIKWVIGDTAGCFLASFSPDDVAGKLKMAFAFEEKTNGRERIVNLGLDNESIARKIIQVYESIVKR